MERKEKDSLKGDGSEDIESDGDASAGTSNG